MHTQVLLALWLMDDPADWPQAARPWLRTLDCHLQLLSADGVSRQLAGLGLLERLKSADTCGVHSVLNSIVAAAL